MSIGKDRERQRGKPRQSERTKELRKPGEKEMGDDNLEDCENDEMMPKRIHYGPS